MLLQTLKLLITLFMHTRKPAVSLGGQHKLSRCSHLHCDTFHDELIVNPG